VVLVAGIVAVQAATTPADPAGDSVITSAVSGSVTIEGLDPSVQRVLQVNGSAQVLTAAEMAEIPDAVARTLIERGVVLTLESGAGR